MAIRLTDNSLGAIGLIRLLHAIDFADDRSVYSGLCADSDISCDLMLQLRDLRDNLERIKLIAEKKLKKTSNTIAITSGSHQWTILTPVYNSHLFSSYEGVLHFKLRPHYGRIDMMFSYRLDFFARLPFLEKPAPITSLESLLHYAENASFDKISYASLSSRPLDYLQRTSCVLGITQYTGNLPLTQKETSPVRIELTLYDGLLAKEGRTDIGTKATIELCFRPLIPSARLPLIQPESE